MRPDLEAIARRAARQPDGQLKGDLLALLDWVACLEAQMLARAEMDVCYPLLPTVLGETPRD